MWCCPLEHVCGPVPVPVPVLVVWLGSAGWRPQQSVQSGDESRPRAERPVCLYWHQYCWPMPITPPLRTSLLPTSLLPHQPPTRPSSTSSDGRQGRGIRNPHLTDSMKGPRQVGGPNRSQTRTEREGGRHKCHPNALGTQMHWETCQPTELCCCHLRRLLKKLRV